MLKDALEFVGWELIGVISQAILDDFQSDAFQECRKILKVIAEVSRDRKLLHHVGTCCPGKGGGGGGGGGEGWNFSLHWTVSGCQ